MKDASNKDHRNNPDSGSWDTDRSGTDTGNVREREDKFTDNGIFFAHSGIADNFIGAYLAVAKFFFIIFSL